jgi:hypothetical protein
MVKARLYSSEPAPISVQAEWDSLFKSMNYWSQAQDIPPHLMELVKDASYFAYRFKRFFDNVSDEQYEQGDTTRSAALHRARLNVIAEWDNIQQALEQRKNERYRERLDELDKLASECLTPILGDATAHRAATYFHKVYDIVRFAFSQKPLLGAPYSALHLPESWLAIPHEAGHYIFWNGTDSVAEFSQFQTSLENAVVQQLAASLRPVAKQDISRSRRPRQVYTTWLSWLDELFADIYGTLVAGPASGWSMQSSLGTRTDSRGLDEDDGEHPYPFLRPFIHIAVLRHMADLTDDHEFANDLRVLATSQEYSWRNTWPPETVALLRSAEGRGKMEAMVRQDLPVVVMTILNVPIPAPDGPPQTLAERFKAGRFYTRQRHERILEAAELLHQGNDPQFESLLERSAAAQMALIDNQNPAAVWKALQFVEELYTPKPEYIAAEAQQRLDARFAEFLKGATGSDNAELQRRAWDMVIEGTLSLEKGHGLDHHHHVHAH